MSKNSGYELSRRWFDFAFENKDAKAIHTAIYMWAVELNNRLGWKNEFGFPTNDTMEGLSIGNRNTYFEALKELVEWGFITVVSESKNRHTATVISLNKAEKGAKKNTALQNVVVQNLTATDTATDTPTDTATAPIDKPINHKPINISFDDFWELYGKKVNKPECNKQWIKLTDKERQDAMHKIPAYKKAQPEKKYRLDPERYLKRKKWNDEIEGVKEIEFVIDSEFFQEDKYVTMGLAYCKKIYGPNWEPNPNWQLPNG